MNTTRLLGSAAIALMLWAGAVSAVEATGDETESTASAPRGSCGGMEVVGQPGASNLYGGTSSNESIDKLDPAFQSSVSAMISAAKAELGGNLVIYSGYRSPEKQAKLYADAVKKYGSEAAARKWVAPPGKSMHNEGKAVDLRFNGTRVGRPSEVDTWISQNASRFGLTRPMSYEPWHVEPVGARSGGSGATAAGGGLTGGACSQFETPEMVLMPWDAGAMSTSVVPGSY